MADLSVIIAAREEEFLQNTIDDVLKKMRGDTEIIVILDGYWPDNGMPIHERVTVVHHEESIGQRAAVNEGARISKAKYIMKLDAHCSVGRGFDLKLAKDCEYDWTVIPRMYNLWVFDWKCHKCGKRTYQADGKPEKCEDCGTTDRFEKKIVWKAKTNPVSDFMRFNKDMKFKYWRSYKDRPEAQGEICDLMSSIGACFFMHRERFWDLGGMDEDHGSWGQFGTEVACKAWLSGGRHVVNKKTWFAHMFRTGKGLGFPWPMSGRAAQFARKYSQDLWLNDKWEKATRTLSWIVDKFSPIPDWHTPDPGSDKERKGKESKIKKRQDRKLDKERKHAKIEKPIEEPQQLTKGMVYYTDNRCEERIAHVVRNQILKSCNGHKIVSVSQYPIDFGENIVVDFESSVLSMFKQILIGLKAIDTDIVFLVEHDVLYNKEHFEFTPTKKDVYFYNTNNWYVRPKDGKAITHTCQQVSGLCAYRDLLIEHYTAKVKKVEDEGFTLKLGYEPGNHKKPRGACNYKRDSFFTEKPLIDIRNGQNLSGVRFRKDQFRRQPKNWQESDTIPHWGRTKGRFYKFLRDVNNAV